MKRWSLRVVLVIVPFMLAVGAGSASAADACARLEQQMTRVEQQMRRLHSAAQGNRLRARLREIRERIAHECR